MASGKTSGMTPEGQGDDSFGAKASSAGHFKCNKRRIADYPNLWSYTRELYQTPGIRETVDFSHIKGHYYQSHRTINPTGIVPLGPIVDFDASPDRRGWEIL